MSPKRESPGGHPLPVPILIPESEIEITAIRASGPGGQNVNKVASAVQLRFDVRASSLPAEVLERLLALRDKRITVDGVLVIKAQRFRSREQNEADARRRLAQLIRGAAIPPKKRKPTRPSRASIQRRLQAKSHRGKVKKWRRDRGEG